jgi:hypothetical protein
MTVLGVLILSVGCTPSLHPIYTENDLVFESSLIGQWTEDDSDEIWEFSKEGASEYKLVITDEGPFSAHLTKVKGKLFLDFFPDEPELKEGGFYKSHLLRVHSFAYVSRIEPTLQMALPNPGWLEKYVAENPDSIRHEKVEDRIIITAGTKALQAFWLKHRGDHSAR